MAVDTSIYFQNKPVDMFGTFAKGYSLGQAIRQDQEEQDLKNAYSQGIVTDANGNTSFDSQKALNAVAKKNPQKYVELKDQFTQKKMAMQKAQQERNQAQTELIARLLPTIKDQATYERGLKIYADNGGDISKMPARVEQAIPLLQQLSIAAVSVQDQQKQQNENRRMGQEDAKIGLQAKELGYKVASGQLLPIDQKEMVQDLSKKNASKYSIANQIDATLKGWDSLSDDQKLTQGRQLLKTLNSQEGADAIGAEEANRLGSKLEFALGNFTNSNPTQFGRDLEGFKKQAELTSTAIKNAIGSNGMIVNNIMRPDVQNAGFKVQDKSSQPGVAKDHPQASTALKWAKDNPTDPRALEILKAIKGGQ